GVRGSPWASTAGRPGPALAAEYRRGARARRGVPAVDRRAYHGRLARKNWPAATTPAALGGEAAAPPSRRRARALLELPAATARPRRDAMMPPDPTPPGETPPGLRTSILAPVFVPTAVVVLALVALSFAAPDTSAALFGRAQAWVADEAGWFTILA